MWHQYFLINAISWLLCPFIHGRFADIWYAVYCTGKRTNTMHIWDVARAAEWCNAARIESGSGVEGIQSLQSLWLSRNLFEEPREGTFTGWQWKQLPLWGNLWLKPPARTSCTSCRQQAGGRAQPHACHFNNAASQASQRSDGSVYPLALTQTTLQSLPHFCPMWHTRLTINMTHEEIHSCSFFQLIKLQKR